MRSNTNGSCALVVVRGEGVGSTFTGAQHGRAGCSSLSRSWRAGRGIGVQQVVEGGDRALSIKPSDPRSA